MFLNPYVYRHGGSMLVTTPAGAIVLQGYAPNVFQPDHEYPSSGAIVFTGQAPTASIAAFGLQPGAGAIVFQGYAPTVSVPLMVPSGAIVFAGYAPSITRLSVTLKFDATVYTPPLSGAVTLQFDSVPYTPPVST